MHRCAGPPGELGRNPLAVTTATVQPALVFPRIHGAGGVLAVDASAAMPSTTAVHRVLVDISDDATTPDGINRRLDDAALNLYAMARVPDDKVRMAILMHGKGMPLALSDAAYARKFGHANHEAKLIVQLAHSRSGGVRMRPGVGSSRLHCCRCSTRSAAGAFRTDQTRGAAGRGLWRRSVIIEGQHAVFQHVLSGTVDPTLRNQHEKA